MAPIDRIVIIAPGSLPALAADAHFATTPGADVVTGTVTWESATPSVDAGVPAWAVGVLARALCADHCLSFLVAPSDAAEGPLMKPSLLDRARGARSMGLISTTDAAQAEAMLDDSTSAWMYRNQVGLLSAREAPPPQVDYATLAGLIRARGLTRWPDLDAAVRGLVLPAHDGDFMQVAFREPQALAAWFARLAEACSAAGVGLEGAAA